MKLIPQDFRTLQKAADVAEAQRELVELTKGKARSWQAEVGMLAVVTALAGLGLVAFLASEPLSETAEPYPSDRQLVELSSGGVTTRH